MMGSRVVVSILLFLITLAPVLSAPKWTDQEITDRWGRVKQIAESLGLTLIHPVPLEIRPKAEVTVHGNTKSYAGAAGDSDGWYETTPERIWVANDVAEWRIFLTLSGSLGQAWLRDHGARGQSTELEIAFCHWVMYKVLKNAGGFSRQAAALEGLEMSAGLRKLLKYERESGGVSSVVEWAKTKTNLP